MFQHTTGANPMILYSVICFIFLKGDTNISECVTSISVSTETKITMIKLGKEKQTCDSEY